MVSGAMSQLPVESPVIEQLRARWQQAIADLGASAAAEDAARAFTLRSSCSLAEGRAYVRRAWQVLAIAD
jgi:hypothetical protein